MMICSLTSHMSAWQVYSNACLFWLKEIEWNYCRYSIIMMSDGANEIWRVGNEWRNLIWGSVSSRLMSCTALDGLESISEIIHV